MTFNYTKHKELWNWLAENPGMTKKDWPGWEETGKVKMDCFACEAVWNCQLTGCVLEWGTPLCTYAESPYIAWLYHSNIVKSELYKKSSYLRKHRESVRMYAKQIANLNINQLDGLEVI